MGLKVLLIEMGPTMSASSMTVGKRFVVTSGVLLALCTILAVTSLVGFNTVGNDVHSLAKKSIPGITCAEAVQLDISALRADQLRLIITEEDRQNFAQF